MELTELAGADGCLEEALQAKRGTFLTKLSTEVDSLIINLDREGCQALLEQMDLHAPQGEALVEMKALRTLRVVGGPKQWQQLEQATLRLLQLLRPTALEELVLIGVDQMKVVRALLAHPELPGSLKRLKLGLHGFHFLAQEDMVVMAMPLVKLRSLHLFGINSHGAPCRDRDCRMFICAGAFLDFLGQVRRPEDVEVLHSNAGILGDDQQIASLLRCLACFSQLRVLKLPLPSLPLSLREVLSLRLALPRLLFFVVELERIEGADEWPEGEDWPPMTQTWPLCETITPLSVFSREFPDHLATPGQAAEEWARLSEEEQRHWVEAAPRIRQAYRRCEHAGGGVSASPPPGQAADTSSGEAAPTWRADPEARELTMGERTAPCSAADRAADAQRASTHDIGDWRAEERSALRGLLAMKATDVCKEKARLRKEPKAARAHEGLELLPPQGSGSHRVARAAQDVENPRQAAQELLPGGPQQCCPREQAGVELGSDAAAAEL
mmetsp:Transcript_44724/g.127654  ORF Transcript_44724/g.127654 Transcript_44724/m.127654 type:complete len:498 (+) Transcript_44724:47-1540(+)